MTKPMPDMDQVYREHSRLVYRYLLSRCQDPSLAEELTQETFYRAFMCFHKYDGSCEIFTWLAAIAKNVFFKYLRKQKLTSLNTALLVEPQREAETNPEELLEQKFLASYVNECVNRLPQKYRDVVFLRIYAELPFSQIADILGITENSAKVVYYRAKNLLRKDLFENEKL